jgi:cytochrome c-type biogenesis protein CcmH
MKLLALMTFVFLTLASPASAQSPEDLANDISQKVMSPFCPGVTLHDCPSQSALDMRDRIEGYARSGMSEADIMDRLEAEYGTAIRAEPSSEGAGLVAWILPAIAALAGGALAIMVVRRWTDRGPRQHAHETDEPRPSESSTSERQRLDAELGQLRGES